MGRSISFLRMNGSVVPGLSYTASMGAPVGFSPSASAILVSLPISALALGVRENPENRSAATT